MIMLSFMADYSVSMKNMKKKLLKVNYLTAETQIDMANSET